MGSFWKIFSLELPKGEDYSDYYDSIDISPPETENWSPTERKRKMNPLKFTPEDDDNLMFFEKGLHQTINNPQSERPLTPYGSLKLGWRVPKVGDEIYNNITGEIGRLVAIGTPSELRNWAARNLQNDFHFHISDVIDGSLIREDKQCCIVRSLGGKYYDLLPLEEVDLNKFSWQISYEDKLKEIDDLCHYITDDSGYTWEQGITLKDLRRVWPDFLNEYNINFLYSRGGMFVLYEDIEKSIKENWKKFSWQIQAPEKGDEIEVIYLPNPIAFGVSLIDKKGYIDYIAKRTAWGGDEYKGSLGVIFINLHPFSGKSISFGIPLKYWNKYIRIIKTATQSSLKLGWQVQPDWILADKPSKIKVGDRVRIPDGVAAGSRSYSFKDSTFTDYTPEKYPNIAYEEDYKPFGSRNDGGTVPTHHEGTVVAVDRTSIAINWDNFPVFLSSHRGWNWSFGYPIEVSQDYNKVEGSLKFADPLTYTDRSDIDEDKKEFDDRALVFQQAEPLVPEAPKDTMWIEPSEKDFPRPGNELELMHLDTDDNTILQNEVPRKKTISWQTQEPKIMSSDDYEHWREKEGVIDNAIWLNNYGGGPDNWCVNFYEDGKGGRHIVEGLTFEEAQLYGKDFALTRNIVYVIGMYEENYLRKQTLSWQTEKPKIITYRDPYTKELYKKELLPVDTKVITTKKIRGGFDADTMLEHQLIPKGTKGIIKGYEKFSNSYWFYLVDFGDSFLTAKVPIGWEESHLPLKIAWQTTKAYAPKPLERCPEGYSRYTAYIIYPPFLDEDKGIVDEFDIYATDKYSAKTFAEEYAKENYVTGYSRIDIEQTWGISSSLRLGWQVQEEFERGDVVAFEYSPEGSDSTYTAIGNYWGRDDHYPNRPIVLENVYYGLSPKRRIGTIRITDNVPLYLIRKTTTSSLKLAWEAARSVWLGCWAIPGKQDINPNNDQENWTVIIYADTDDYKDAIVTMKKKFTDYLKTHFPEAYRTGFNFNNGYLWSLQSEKLTNLTKILSKEEINNFMNDSIIVVDKKPFPVTVNGGEAIARL